jgi:hypothetical protein
LGLAASFPVRTVRIVRRLRLALLAALLIVSVPSAAASASALDPKALVLVAGDVPSSFRLDRPNTGVETNAQIARNEPSARTKLAAWRRVTGYKIEFDRDGTTIASRADVFRSPSGAQQMLEYLADEIRNGGIKGLARDRVDLGAGGWLYGGRDPGRGLFFLAWRDGRVFAALGVFGLTRRQALAFANAQQRRIAVALR